MIKNLNTAIQQPLYQDKIRCLKKCMHIVIDGIC